MSIKDTKKQFFPALTGYRAIAAWMIFVYHFFPFQSTAFHDWIKKMVWQFHIGVDMFFVLSGFLITYRYFNEHPINFKRYIVNRFARIYPMYFIITLLVFTVGFFKTLSWDSETTLKAILSFTMTKALFFEYRFAGIAQGWTLTLEELFYLTAPFYFTLIRKKNLWLIAIPAIIILFGIIGEQLFSLIYNPWGFLQTGIHFFILEFFGGIALGLLILRFPNRKPPRFKYFTYWGVVFILLYIFGKDAVNQVFNLKTTLGRVVELTLLTVLGITPILYGLIFEKTILRSVLSSELMVLLGKSSYIFYLIHKGFIPIFINDYISNNKLFIFVLLNIISVFMFKYLEEPANRWIRRRFT